MQYADYNHSENEQNFITRRFSCNFAVQNVELHNHKTRSMQRHRKPKIGKSGSYVHLNCASRNATSLPGLIQEHKTHTMKNFFFIVAILTVLFTGTSGMNEERFDTQPGAMAPIFEVANSANTVSLSDLRGRYTLVTFWNSTDAASRMACNEYNALVDNDHALNGHIAFLGINLDASKTLFEEITKIDDLNKDSQYHVEGDVARHLVSLYGLDKGMGSVLIDPHGKVVTYNPSPEFLKSIAA